MALVLVVDDEILIVNLLTELLEDFGYKTLQAANGIEALALAHLHRPALIITDVMMPLMDGLCLLQAVRNAPDLIETAVVLASAAPTCLPAQECAPHADGFIPKPFDINAIEHMLDRFVSTPRFIH